MMEQLSSQEVMMETVHDALEKAYGAVSAETGVDISHVHQERVCEQVSERLVQELESAGVDAELLTYRGWDVISHEFVRAKINNDDWIIDPTWQQFLTEKEEGLPKALVARESELEDALVQYEVPAQWHHIWKQ